MANSHLQTDSAKAYETFGQEFISHEAVNHFAGEYVRGEVSTNRLENYFSQLKRSIDGTHHHVSKEHLPRYLAEFDFSTSAASSPTRSGCSGWSMGRQGAVSATNHFAGRTDGAGRKGR